MKNFFVKNKVLVIVVGSVLLVALLVVLGILVGPKEKVPFVGKYHTYLDDEIVEDIHLHFTEDGNWYLESNGTISEEGTYEVVSHGKFKAVLDLEGIRYFINGSTETFTQRIEIHLLNTPDLNNYTISITNFHSYAEYRKIVPKK